MAHLAMPGELLGTVSKHHVAGIVAIVVGAILLLLGLARLAGRLMIGAFVPAVGIVILVIGILLYARIF